MADETPDPSTVYVGQCRSPMSQTLGYAAQHFCHVADGDLNDDEVEELLDLWNLSRPNLILELLGAAAPHPELLLGKESLTNPNHAAMVEEVRKSFALATENNSEDAPAGVPNDDRVVTALSKRMYAQMVQNIASLLRACEQTNSWITLKDGPQVTGPILADALMQCDSRPVIFVCEKYPDYTHGAPKLFETLWKEQKLLSSMKSKLASGTAMASPQLEKELWPWSWTPGKGLSSEPAGNYPVPFATHYVFSKSWAPFNLSKLGPSGTLYVGGGGGCVKTMRLNLVRYQPNVVMMHSGRGADVVGAALMAIMSDGLTTADAVISRMKEIVPFWYQSGGYLFDVVKADQLYELVSSLLVAYKNNPQVFKTSTVVLDTMKTTPEEVLNELSQCFGSATAGMASLEAGASNANEGILASAWDVHRRLEAGCTRFLRLANHSTVAAALLSFATTFASVSSIAWPDEKAGWNPLSIILPAVTGIVVTLRSRFRFVAKWGSMHMAMVQIESEIWKFRTGCGQYDPMGLSSSQKDGDKKTKSDGKNDKKDKGQRNMKGTRHVFSERISELYSHLLGGEMVNDALEPAPDAKHLAIPLLSSAEQKHLSAVGSEEYFELRIGTAKERFEKLAPSLARRLVIYEVLIVVSTLVTTLLAALHLKLWIPVSVGITTVITTFMEYEALSSRLTAVNSAIAELNSFTVEWAGMNVLERRSRLVKQMMVKATEAVVEREAAAYTSMSGLGGPVKKKGKDEQTEEKKKD